MRLMRAIHRNERGHLLIVSAFIILIFTSLSIMPVLDFMGTGIITAQNAGLHTQEIYAAEAGVFDSMWKIIVIEPGVPRGMWDPPLVYSIDGGVNGKRVDVTVSRHNSFNFRVSSVATDPRTSHQSTVETDVAIIGVSGLDLAEFAKFAVTSNGTIGADFYNVKINGNIWIPDINNYDGKPPNGEIIVAPITGWPTEEMLVTYYSFLVNKDNPCATSVINISNPVLSGPLYALGAGNYVLTGTGTLTGALYIDGNLYVDGAANVNLDGNTIFVTGNFQTHPNSYIAGPGALIALDDIVFSPNVAPTYLLVMSINGEVDFQPSGAYVGAVGGNVDITMRPNSSITWQDPGVGNLDLPGIYNHIRAIETWSIK